MLALLARHGRAELSSKQILEIGCGGGFWLRTLVQWGVPPEHLFGIDLVTERVQQARATCPAGVTIECGSAARLPWDGASFDLVLQSTVFTSVLAPAERLSIAREMLRVVRPDGLLLWYDYHMDNPANPDVRGVGRREIERLFRGHRIELERITLAPPLARRLAGRSWLLCQLLEAFPLLCTHYLGIIHP